MAALFCLLTSFVAPPGPAGTEKARYINGSRVIFNEVIQLYGANEFPVPVETQAHGIAHLRLTEDGTLYSKVIVTQVDPEEDGALTMAHIHPGTATQTGPPLIWLVHDVSEFGKNVVIHDLTSEQVTAILEAPLYVNAHSTVYPAGLVRGQIR